MLIGNFGKLNFWKKPLGGGTPSIDYLSSIDGGDAAAVYSLRKAYENYTGSAIRVVRSSDSTQMDIGFVGEDLDTEALMDFVGNQNLLRHSEEFENAVWEGLPNSAETIDINTELAPDGTMTADKCTILGASSGSFQKLVLNSAGRVTFSTYIKASTSGTFSRVGMYDTAEPGNQARLWINMTTGQIGTISIVGTGWSDATATSTDVGNGWFRVSITATCTVTSVSVLITNATGDNSTNRTVGHNRILWGAQLNTGPLQPYTKTVETANTGNATVQTWYDQSPNARNQTQASSPAQPLIVQNGSLITENGKPSILFDGVDDFLSSSLNAGIVGNQAFSMFFVSKNITQMEANNIVSIGQSSWISAFQVLGIGQDTASSLFVNLWSSESNYSIDVTPVVTTNNASYGYIHTGSAQNPYANGELKTTRAFTLDIVDNPIRIGGRTGGFAGQPANVKIQEVIVYPSDKSSNRTSIESNINNYYDIY